MSERIDPELMARLAAHLAAKGIDPHNLPDYPVQDIRPRVAKREDVDRKFARLRF